MDLRQYLDSDDTLSLQAGTLFLEGCSLAEIARAHGTPLHVVSEERLRRRAREFVAEFSRAWSEGPVQVLPSLKANHSLALRRILTQEGLGCDTFGYGELRAALACGVPPELISVNGSGKPAQLIREAILAGAVLTLDSLREVGLARTISDELQRRAAVRLRLRPDYRRLGARSEFVADEHSIGEVTRHYKPGLPHDDLLEAARLLRESERLELVGCHAHVGRQRADLAFWGAAIPCFVAEIVALSQAMGGDWRPSQIDVGGGFAPRRDPVGLAFEGREAPRSDVPTVRQYAECVASSLREGMRRAGLPTQGLILQLEPGRGLYANGGLHLSTVVNLKQERSRAGDGVQRWIETDTSEAFLPDVNIEGVRWTAVAVSQVDATEAEPADVVGISCGFDVLVANARLPQVVPGDVLAFLDTGAYQDAGSNNFNAMPRPATVLVHGETAEVIKQAETLAQVFQRDVVPGHLKDGLATGAAWE